MPEECQHPHWAIVDFEKTIYQKCITLSDEVVRFEFYIRSKCRCRLCTHVTYSDQFIRTIDIEITLKPANPDPEIQGGADAVPV